MELPLRTACSTHFQTGSRGSSNACGARADSRPSDVDEVLREIRTALLEADVNVGVVRGVVERIREQCVGIELSKALSPSQQIVKIVNDELTAMLGGETLKITYASRPPTVVLMAGLQGSGKTTASGKLARWFKAQGRHPLLVGADLQRPAAVEQLRTLGRQIDVPVFSEPGDPVTDAPSGVCRRPGGSGATCSSSTPPAASPSTRS